MTYPFKDRIRKMEELHGMSTFQREKRGGGGEEEGTGGCHSGDLSHRTEKAVNELSPSYS